MLVYNISSHVNNPNYKHVITYGFNNMAKKDDITTN